MGGLGQFVVPFIFGGLGGGLFGPPIVASIFNPPPAPRRGGASGMSSTLINTGFLLSLGIAFAVMASSVPSGVLQEIFSGATVRIDPVVLDNFQGALHGLFVLMGFVSLFAAVPAFLAKKPRIRYEDVGAAAGD